MPSTPTTKSQVQAYQFVLRRMQSALVRRDAVMLHDPMRTHTRATIVGVVLGALGMIVFVVWGLLSPAPSVPEAGNIVIGEQSGTVYVVTGNPKKLIPTFNLASARLLLLAQQKSPGAGAGGATAAPAPAPASPASVKNPTVVSDDQLKDIPRDKLTGIPDGPQLIPTDSQRIPANWAVCDQVQLDTSLPNPDTGRTNTYVFGGIAPSGLGTELGENEALLAKADNGKTYLVYRLPSSRNRPNANTVRAEIDVDNPNDAVRTALQLPPSPRKITQGLLNAIPEVAKLSPPKIPSGQAPADFDGLTSGDVFATQQAGQRELNYWAITPTGIQRVSNAVADIIRVAKNGSSSSIQTLGLDKLAGVKTLQPNDPDYIPVDDFPRSVPTILDATKNSSVACLGWSLVGSGPDQDGHTSVYVDTQLPGQKSTGEKFTPMAVTTPGPNRVPLNGFYVKPGFAAVVQSATGKASFGKGAIQLISDRGVRYSVPDAQTADAIGLNNRQPAPESIIGLLPTGASLNTQDVLRQFDAVPIDPNAGAFPTTQQPAN
ncbi:MULTISPECIES: type VII secretion protein EccB [unclassified Amycolatopsis]|uniref:type VII secretion protein EccB n=1 Tax=unclassified Amycolatopsis TaxID=2618356 RepID=UPI00287494CB|nr:MULTISPECIES: type VII secretion protein EccB [unclassified Amycolatopsis]MDS0132366.1 type VII secretion protein EccB [Amycolatopsis sp. 505]MDS0142810.1 type VII secretion protein EccB [Amycolatopsis sp. CM201R]